MLTQILENRRLLPTDQLRLGALKHPFPPALLTTVEVVVPIVLAHRPRLAGERGDLGVFDAVCDAADGGAEVAGVVRGGVARFGVEVEDEVVAGDEEFLQDGAGGEELDGGGGRHDLRLVRGCVGWDGMWRRSSRCAGEEGCIYGFHWAPGGRVGQCGVFVAGW